jgi:chromosome partitioning protein
MGKPLVFVINGATARARITAEAVVALSEHGPLAPAIIHHRVDYAASMIDGRTVMELGNSARGAEEIGQLWEYLARRLGMSAGDLPQGVLPHLDEADQAFPQTAVLRAAS